MSKTMISRRTLFGASAWGLAAVSSISEIASAHSQAGLSPNNDKTVRKYYAGWERKDWHAFDMLLTDDFTFSSPLDARISKSAFKTGCWDTQIAYIGRFELEH